MDAKYKVGMNIKTMENVIKLIDFYNNNFPFTIESLHSFRNELSEIIDLGCFKHNRLRERFEKSSESIVAICPECNPKEYKKYKRGYLTELYK